jgi:hypothetical protein
MDATRREFLERAAAGAAMFGVLPPSIDSTLRELDLPAQGQQWDLSWTKRITGKRKTVFDVPGIESGLGVWRASIWGRQYMDVLGVKPNELTTVLVLRHDAIALAMQQSYWDKYGTGKAKEVTHPLTQQPTDRNPVLLSSSRGEVPEQFDGVMLDKFIARGGIALGCNLAFQKCVDTVQSKDSVGAEEARKRAIAMLVPGVILQPSGVFAATLAQESGCTYLRAS